MRLSAYAVIGLITLILTAGHTSPAQEQPREDDHTDPPILIFHGGLVWYKASQEAPTQCVTDTDCDRLNSAYPLCRTMNSDNYCVKALESSYSVFDASGECADKGYEDRLDPAFIFFGTDWAWEEDPPSSAHRKKYKMKGKDVDGKNLELRLEIGDKTTSNAWFLKKAGKECRLTSTNPIVGSIPSEFLQLTELKRKRKDRLPVSFAACRYENCEHSPDP